MTKNDIKAFDLRHLNFRSISKAGPELVDATGHDIPSLLKSILELVGYSAYPFI